MIANGLMFDSAALRQRQVPGNASQFLVLLYSALRLSLPIANGVLLGNPNEVARV